MTIKIPATAFDGLAKWMVRGPWPEHFEDATDDHLHAWCDLHDLDTFEEMAAKIGQHWLSVLNEMAMTDFLSRDTEDGNVVDLYLKRRGWNENAIPKAYLKAIRGSVMCLYEVSEIRPGESFTARELIRGGRPSSCRRTVRHKDHAPMGAVGDAYRRGAGAPHHRGRGVALQAGACRTGH